MRGLSSTNIHAALTKLRNWLLKVVKVETALWNKLSYNAQALVVILGTAIAIFLSIVGLVMYLCGWLETSCALLVSALLFSAISRRAADLLRNDHIRELGEDLTKMAMNHDVQTQNYRSGYRTLRHDYEMVVSELKESRAKCTELREAQLELLEKIEKLNLSPGNGVAETGSPRSKDDMEVVGTASENSA